MSSMHPTVVEALARQRQAELLRTAELGSRSLVAARTETRGAHVDRAMAGLLGLVRLVHVRRPTPVVPAPCC